MGFEPNMLDTQACNLLTWSNGSYSSSFGAATIGVVLPTHCQGPNSLLAWDANLLSTSSSLEIV